MAKDEYKDLLVPDENFAGTHPMKVYPVSDGDVFDLGGHRFNMSYDPEKVIGDAVSI